MQVKEFKDILAMTKLPVAYYAWPKDKVPPLPYLVYYFPDWDDLLADNINYVNIANVNVELYCEDKDFETEYALEEILNSNNLFFNKTEQYLDSEEMYETLYQIRVLININKQ